MCDLATDAAEADHAENLVLEFAAEEAGPLPAPGLDRLVGLGKVSR